MTSSAMSVARMENPPRVCPPMVSPPTDASEEGMKVEEGGAEEEALGVLPRWKEKPPRDEGSPPLFPDPPVLRRRIRDAKGT